MVPDREQEREADKVTYFKNGTFSMTKKPRQLVHNKS